MVVAGSHVACWCVLLNSALAARRDLTTGGTTGRVVIAAVRPFEYGCCAPGRRVTSVCATVLCLGRMDGVVHNLHALQCLYHAGSCA